MRDALIEAAFRILVEDPAAGLQEIAKQAGISRAAIYRRYSNREQLIQALREFAIEDLKALSKNIPTDSTCEDKLRHLFHGSINMGTRYSYLKQNQKGYESDDHAAIVTEKKFLVGVVEEAKIDGLFDEKLPTIWITRVFETIISAAIKYIDSREMTQKRGNAWAWRALIEGFGFEVAEDENRRQVNHDIRTDGIG